MNKRELTQFVAKASKLSETQAGKTTNAVPWTPYCRKHQQMLEEARGIRTPRSWVAVWDR